MHTALCKDCFPDVVNHEILTVGIVHSPCAQCGRRDRFFVPGGPELNLFRTDPRDKEKRRKVKINVVTKWPNGAVLYTHLGDDQMAGDTIKLADGSPGIGATVMVMKKRPLTEGEKLLLSLHEKEGAKMRAQD